MPLAALLRLLFCFCSILLSECAGIKQMGIVVSNEKIISVSWDWTRDLSVNLSNQRTPTAAVGKDCKWKFKKRFQVQSPMEQNFEIQKLSLLTKNRHFWSEIIHQVWSEMSKFLSGAEKREKSFSPNQEKKLFCQTWSQPGGGRFWIFYRFDFLG